MESTMKRFWSILTVCTLISGLLLTGCSKEEEGDLRFGPSPTDEKFEKN